VDHTEFFQVDIKTLQFTRWNGGRRYLRRGKEIGDERFDSVRGECPNVKL
jgi:hypothetical protein